MGSTTSPDGWRSLHNCPVKPIPDPDFEDFGSLPGRPATISRSEMPDWRRELGRWPERLAAFPAAAGYFLLIGGLALLLSWVFLYPQLHYLIDSLPRMFPINAFCSMVFGVLLLLRSGRWRKISPQQREAAAAALLMLVLALSLVRIGQYLFAWQLPFDLRLFPIEGLLSSEVLGATVQTPPSALNFLLLAIALLIRRDRGNWLFQALPLLVLLIAGLSLGNYLYGGVPLFAATLMSIPTSALQIVAAAAVLCLRTELGLPAMLLEPTAGGMLMRRLLAPALVLPPFLGWVRLAGQRAGYYELEAGVTLYAFAVMILFGTLVWWASSWLSQTDLLREEAVTETRRQLARLHLLQQITRATTQRQDPRKIYEVALRTLEDRLPVEFAAIWIIDPKSGLLELGQLGEKSGAMAPALAAMAAGETAESIETTGLEDALAGQRVYLRDLAAAQGPLPRLLAGVGLRSAVLVRLQAEDRLFGLLTVGRFRPWAFSNGSGEFLTQLADNVAIAVFQAELHRELEAAYLDLRTTQQSALERDRLRALGEMASGIAHDLNNAISPAALHLESVLEKNDLSAHTRERLDIVRRAVLDAAHTVSRMQVIYRQHKSAQAERIQLNPLVDHVIDLTRAKWRDTPQERGHVIEVVTRLDPQLPAIAGNESEIREALTNLVFNAVDAMPQGGRLELRTYLYEDSLASQTTLRRKVAIEVTDTGIGMDEETRRRCLEPFFTTKGERGSGLGLPRVFAFAERHGGSVQIDSEPGRGTAVRLIFPAVERALTPPPAEEARSSRPLRVEVVDDDPILLETLKEIFETDGHEVIAASGGAAGIELFGAAHANGEPVDLVVTDLGMPQVDGRQVAEAIKALSPGTPIILLTGWGHRMVSERVVPPNFDLVISKPPRLGELRQALANLAPQLAEQDRA